MLIFPSTLIDFLAQLEKLFGTDSDDMRWIPTLFMVREDHDLQDVSCPYHSFLGAKHTTDN